MLKVFVYSTHSFDKPYLQKAQNNHVKFSFTQENLNLDTVKLCNGYDGIALFSSDHVCMSVLEILKQNSVKYICLRSAGYDNINISLASQLGFKVANIPNYSPESIAEHEVAMLLALNRKLIQAHLLVKKQDFRIDTLVGSNINGKTIGLVGTGNIGMAFAKIMHGFGTKLLAYDPVYNNESKKINLRYTTFDYLVKNSDIIAINCPLNVHTHYMFNSKVFAKMKQGAVLINAARGGIVNTLDLITYLKNGKLGGACIDVYEKEKDLFFKNYKNQEITDLTYLELAKLDNVLITAHQAFLTKEALESIAKITVDNFTQWDKNIPCLNQLN